MTPRLSYTHVSREDGTESLTVFIPGEHPVTVAEDHPHFTTILQGLADDSLNGGTVRDLADLSGAAAAKLNYLSERVAVANGHVYFDGDVVDSALTRQIIRLLDNGDADWRPLVRFMENLAENPQEHSRSQLFDWLRDRDFTILSDGTFVAYKGVASDGNGGFTSVNRGPAIVNGKQVDGAVPQPIGGVVEIPRSRVAFDPAVGCASGLHAGTWEYASSFGEGGTLKVAINPRDVVSVPTDSSAAKLRVCRYRVLEATAAPVTTPFDSYDELYDDEYDDYRDARGDYS